ncbi:MAG: hypothetical protein AB7R67_20105 [Vicinamibacterales bacterium]
MADRQTGFDWDDALRRGAFAHTTPASRVPEPGSASARPSAGSPRRASTRMAPAAVESRRSGRTATRGPGVPGDGMLVYRDALRRIQPATDHQVSAFVRTALGLDGRDHVAWGLSSINGRRNDWTDLEPDCIQAVGKVRPPGGRASRTLWQIRPGSLADTTPSPAKGGLR